MRTQEQERNDAAYRRLEQSIKNTYPYGPFVAIAGGEIVGVAADFMAMHRLLKAAGRDPRHVLIVQAENV